jgi:hypothetical protein
MRITLTGRRLALAAVLAVLVAGAVVASGALAGRTTSSTATATSVLTAVVNYDGTLVRGTATAATRDGEGIYIVTFSRAVNDCVYSPAIGAASTAVIGLNGEISASHSSASVFDVLVATLNSAGGFRDQSFHLVVTCPEAATVADVAGFRAGRVDAQRALLRWTTGAETEILGFNVWRYRGAKGVKVNRTLVRAKRSGEPAGASYRFVDQVRGAKRGLTYRLQLVDLKGKRTWYAAFAIASR